MNDVLNDKAWLEKMMYIIRINQWDNRFGVSNLFFGTSRMLTFYTAGKVHKPIHIYRHPTAMFYTAGKSRYNHKEYSAYGIRVREGTYANLKFK